MPSPNPFKPTAGANPPLLVGRDQLVDEFTESIDNGPGAPGRLSIFTGPRGIGKTVMLNAVADQVQAEHQWLVIHDTATHGFIDRLTATITRHLQPGTGRHLTGITLPVIGGGITMSPPSQDAAGTLREALTQLLEDCDAHHSGVLITLDEIHSTRRDELVQFAATVQHLIREDRQIAVALAGLPHAVNELLNDRLATFLRRADRHDLEDIPLDQVADALAETIAAHGRAIQPDALRIAAEATGGYPFMIQLVGYHIWRKTSGATITAEAATAGTTTARARLGSLVHAPALRDLSDIDRTFLLAMTHDDGPARIADIARRIGKTTQYANVYRARLIAAGMITPAGHGQIEFALPYLREYLRHHATHLLKPQEA